LGPVNWGWLEGGQAKNTYGNRVGKGRKSFRRMRHEKFMRRERARRKRRSFPEEKEGKKGGRDVEVKPIPPSPGSKESRQALEKRGGAIRIPQGGKVVKGSR